MPLSPANAAPASAAPRLCVLLPVPLGETFDYRPLPGAALDPGQLVRVSFGRREIVGVVWDGPTDSRDSTPPPLDKLKSVIAVLDMPPMTEPLRRLVDWVAAYTLNPRGAILRMALSVPAAFEPPAPITVYRPGAEPPARMTAARERVLALLANGPPMTAAEIVRETGVGRSVVTSLAQASGLVPESRPGEASFARPDPACSGPTLSPEQRVAAERLAAGTTAQEFSVLLLDGVTGAGKTEVYFEAVAAALRAGRQALVLLPEIALGAQWHSRFAARFGVAPAEWHSELSPRRRRETWRAVALGHAPVVVGARSALFLPFPDLGLIVVDEEHDAAYKQEDGVIYNARDMAVVRARLSAAPCVLASATPSLETVVNADQGRYERLRLPNRHGGASLPAVVATDMRKNRPPSGRWLSEPLIGALTTTLAEGEQALLFLNRRGYAPLTLCRACGHRLACPNCSAWLVEHRQAGRLQCHHCGFTRGLPEECPDCGAEGSLAACGPGVERLAEEVAAGFPDARVLVAASDTLTGPKAAAELIEKITAREVDLVIGTQVLAKGHHFPMLTLVGVVDADLGLEGGDLRAAERTFQMLHQVAGRAGRGERPGRVLLQTYMPEHPVMAALIGGERDEFLACEAAERKRLGWPPFGRLAALILSGPSEEAARRAALELGRHAPRGKGITVLGPAPAPLALLRGRHRQRLLIKTGREVRLQEVVRRWLQAARLDRDVRLRVDVDPYSFL